MIIQCLENGILLSTAARCVQSGEGLLSYVVNSPQCSGGCPSGWTGAACLASVMGGWSGCGCGSVLGLSGCFPPQMCCVCFLTHACLVSGTLTSVWWVQITKIKLIPVVIYGSDFYSETMNVALGTATSLKYIFTGAFSADLWTFKADLYCVFEQFSGVLMAPQSSLSFLTRSKHFASRLRGWWTAFAAGLINGVCLV